MRPNQLPQMASLDDRSVSVIPNGGVNSSRLENEIDDNQLSDGLNIWYKDSLLRFRPGLIKQVEQTYGKIIDFFPKDGREILLIKIFKDGTVLEEIHGIYIITHTAVLIYDGTKIERVPSGFELSGNNVTPTYTDYSFNNIAIIDGTFSEKINTSTNRYVQGSTIYIFGDGYYLSVSPQIDALIYPPTSPELFPRLIIGPVLYKVPTIYTNMKPSGSGDKLESRNYMTPWVYAECLTDNSATVYHLPDQHIDNAFVKATYNNLSGTISGFEWGPYVTVSTVNNITATLDRTAGTITFSTTLVDAAAAQDKVPNLKYYYSKTVYATSPMLNCSIGALFGGSYQGQASGDCIFLSGNPSEPNAVYWSAVNDPTYFPDDCVDYVGEPSDPVTAFGKCFGVLVIFKQSSIYQKGFSWDSTTSKQYFPTEELKIGVGCDSPKSVQIINNHLVWLSSNGGIYTIVSTSTTSSSANIYTERNIVPLSRNVNKQILSESLSDLQAAVGVDDGYYYHLFVGTHDYLWDYTTTPFINYQDTSKLQNRLAWYIWSIPKSATAAVLYNDKIWIAASDNNFLYALDPDSALDDGGAWFDAYIKSKDFDFTAPFLLKKVYYLSLTLASKGSVTALVTLTDDYGDIEQAETLEDGGNEETITTLSYNQPTGFTKKFMVSVSRMKDDNSAFAVNQITALAKLGRKV